MGKSIRSKIKKRLRTAKRQRVDAMIGRPREAEHFEDLQKVIDGRAVRLARAPNAFKYPDAPGAVFPQHEVMKPIDFRASNLPMAAYAFRGNRRKWAAGEEEEMMKNIAQNNHPKMEVLAGGGAILANTGERVSLKEAELEATKAKNPEVAAIAEAGPSRAASAVAAAVAQDEMDMKGDAQAPISDAEDIPEPGNNVDTSRRPLVKDTRRAQRNRPRANAVKKKTKPESKATTKADARADDKASLSSTQAAPAAANTGMAVEGAETAGTKKKKVKGKKVVAVSEKMEMD